MEIVFVGAGRLATNLARALHEGGHRITAVYSRTQASAAALCSVVGGFPTDSIESLPLSADAFILALKDSVLADIIPQLAKGREGQMFFHTAGSIPLSVFEGCNLVHYGVLYPMQTFSKERQVDFTHVPFFIEGNDSETKQLGKSIASSVSDNVRELSSEGRRRLHLAAVFACNFSNHCYALSAEILKDYDVPFSVMLPLIAETAEKVKTLAPREAQTGPAVRFDENVIASQSALLTDRPLMQEIYDLMSKSIHQLAND